jgi:hypothetical protein
VIRVRTIAKLADKEDLERARRERGNVTRRLRRLKNPEKARAQWRAWRAKNAAKNLETQRKWRAKNKEKVNAYCRRYFELNPAVQEYRVLKNREYRARKRSHDAA